MPVPSGEKAPQPELEYFAGSLVVDGMPIEPDPITTAMPVMVQRLWKMIPALSSGQHDLRIVANGPDFRRT